MTSFKSVAGGCRWLSLVLVLASGVAQAARDISDAEFLQCNDQLQQVMTENEIHERNFVTPLSELQASLDHIAGTLAAVDREMALAIGADAQQLADTRLQLQALQRRLEQKRQSLGAAEEQSTQRLIATQVAFRQSCLVGIKVPKAVHQQFCPSRDSLPLCGIFK